MVPMILTNGKLELWSRHTIKKQKRKTSNHDHTYKHVFIYFVIVAILNDVTAIFAKSINKQALNSYNNSGSISDKNSFNLNNNEYDIGKTKNGTQFSNRNYYSNLDTVTALNEISRHNRSSKVADSSFSEKRKSLLTSSSFNNVLLKEKNISNTLDIPNNKINLDPVSPNFDYNDFGFNDNSLSTNNLPRPPPSSTLSNRRSNLPKATPDSDVQFSTLFNTSAYSGNDTFNTTDGSNSTEYYTDEPLSDVILMGVMSVILGILILITVIGNVFVIAAILLERNLQNVANYLIVSLAVADLMVACLVMPLGAVYEISRGWILGPELCDMWTSSDVLCCTASILHLVAIAVDRYWAVTNVDYIHTRNAGRIVTMIVVIWSVAIVVSLAPQFGWKDPDYLDRINLQQRCLVSQDLGYQIFATCSTFYVPLLVILVLYWKIFQTARKRIRRRRAQRNAVLDGSKDKTGINKQHNTENKRLNFLKRKKFLRLKKNKSDKNLSKEGVSSSLVLVEGQSTCSTIEIVDDESAQRRESNCEHEIGVSTNTEQTTAFTISSNHAVTPTNLSPEKSSGATATTNNGSTSHQSEKVHKDPSAVSTIQQQQVQQQKLQQQQQQQQQRPGINSQMTKRDTKKESIEAKREKKAAKTLAIITGAFVVCWLPFFIMALLMPLCESCYINDYVASFFLWLGYFNSTLNPVIYTIFSPEFRQAFKRILCGVSSTRNRGRKLR